MPGVSIQFHMLLDELIEFVADMMVQFSVAVELEQFFPKKTAFVAHDGNLIEKIRKFGRVDRIWLLCKPVRYRTYERFNLYVGETKNGKREQSHLGAGTEKSQAFLILKKIAYQLKKRTQAGIWVTNIWGDSGFDKNFRCSPAAAQASREGTVTLMGIGEQIFTVDPPRQGKPKRRTSKPEHTIRR